MTAESAGVYDMRDFEQSIIINEKIKLEERFEFRTIFPNLKSPLLHHLFGTRLVRRETYSFDRRSLHSFLREYSSGIVFCGG